MLMNLETERLILRSLEMTDLADFLEYRSDPEVCEFQSYEPFSEAEAERYIKNLENGEFGEAGKWIQLGIELKAENKLIGDIGLKPEGHETRIVEFGISLSRKYQKQGLAAEALTEVFDLLFGKVGIHRIKATVDAANFGCIRMLENMKFRREAEFVKSFWQSGMWRDEYLYAILEEEWGEMTVEK